MDKLIEKALENNKFSTQGELEAFVKETQTKIAKYEKMLYQTDAFDEAVLDKLKRWRVKLFKIARDNKELPATEDKDEKAGLEALNLLNKQVELADTNQKILQKSTVKIMSLDYSSKELENVMIETTKKIEVSVNNERKEDRRLVMSFMLFIGICLAILADKLYLKFK